ncbi:MAG TPA: ROK family transcriptional regulator [Fusibacter sp.]|nr:ROK family transcriptional regulator [Fusibacter sp.]
MIDYSIIKSQNRSLILRAFREKNIIQKKELSDLLGLSIPTVTTNTRQLLEEGYIEEVGIAESTGGRKPVVFKFLKSAKVSFGVDLSPQTATVIMTNLASEIIAQNKISVLGMSLDAILETIHSTVDEMLKAHKYQKNDCVGIGLSLPGVVDDARHMLINAPNLHVKNYDFSRFETTLGLDVFIENEANASAFAELTMGTAVNIDDAVYISITEGLGCGIIAGHKVTKGTFNKAGEFGHMRISEQDITCSCGRRGCWEIFASENALFKHYAGLSGEVISDLESFFAQYDAGNPLAKLTLSRYLDNLLIGIENIMLALDSEIIIIGGEIAQYLRALGPQIEDYLEKNHSNILSRDNKIVFSILAPQSAAIGSSLLPLKEMFGY